MSKGKKVLLTGGAGYLGVHLIVELIGAGYDVVVADNFSNSTPKALDAVQALAGRAIKIVRADIGERIIMRRLFDENAIDAVIHLAGSKAARESVEKPLDYYNCNVVGTLTLLEVMREKGVKKLLYSSSAAVYGMHNPSPYREDMPIGRCASPYGQTKAVTEEILQALAVSDPKWHIGILRYFNAVGAHESGRIGENPMNPPANLSPCIARVAIGKEPYLTINGDDYDTPDGTCIRDYVHVQDLTSGHSAALTLLFLSGGCHVYNLGTGKGISVLEMLETYRQISGHPIPVQKGPRRSGDLPSAYADVSKARCELGWIAKRDLACMIEDTWRWVRTHPNGY